jgi:hypothetical protein
MRARIILVLVAIIAATAVASAATAMARPSSTRPHSSRLTLLAPPGGTTTTIDLGKHGISPGDEFVTTDAPLRRPGSHTRAGRIDLIEIAMGKTRSSLSFTAELAHGTLQVQGTYNPNHPHFTLPIVGGTGHYFGAHGAVTFNTGGGTPTLTFDILT